MVASAATLWVWLPGRRRDRIDTARSQDARGHARRPRRVGPTAEGIDGFRRSHLDALTTQHMLARLRSPHASPFDDVQLVALITDDPDRAEEFVQPHPRRAGDGRAGDCATRAHLLNEQCNATRTAARLYTHRNTVLRRLARADELLPRPLAENSVNVAVALDVVRWRSG